MVSVYLYLFNSSQSALNYYESGANGVNGISVSKFGSTNSILILNTTTISGLGSRSIGARLFPAYGKMQSIGIGFPYKNYFVAVQTWGSLSNYNQTYPINIARHIYSMIATMTKGCNV